MAEFCIDCWNKIMETNDPPRKYWMSQKYELCEECGQIKPVIIRVKYSYLAAEQFCELIHRLTGTESK